MMKNLIAGGFLLLALVAAVPTAQALNPIDPTDPVDCRVHNYDFDGDGIPDFIGVGCRAPVRGCVWVNLSGRPIYCTG